MVEGRARKTRGHELPMEKWPVLIQDHHPGYISWDEYMARSLLQVKISFDDTNVALLVANPRIAPATVPAPVQTAQIAPSILSVLGLDPKELAAVQIEGTQKLPGFARE